MESWEDSFQQAIALRKQCRYEDATYYLVNALGTAPGQMSLIAEFTDLLRAWARQAKDQGDGGSAFQNLERAEGFLRDRLPFVASSDVPKLLQLIRDVIQERDTSFAAPPAEQDPRDVQARQDIAALSSGEFDLSDQGKALEIQRRIERLRGVLELLPTMDPGEKLNQIPWRFSLKAEKAKKVELHSSFLTGVWQKGIMLKKDDNALWATTVPVPINRVVEYKFMVDGVDWVEDQANPPKDTHANSSILTFSYASWLEERIGRLEMAFRFETLFEEVHRLLETARTHPHRSAAVMLLQQAEQAVRQLVTWPENDGRVQKIGQMLDKLRIEGDRMAEAGRKDDAEAVWDRFQLTFEQQLVEARYWFAGNGPAKIDGSGHIQNQIRRIQVLMRALQDVLPKLNHQDVAKKAIVVAEEFSNLMTVASQKQQRAYNEWAMTLLKKAMKEGDVHTGVIDDEVSLGKSMENNFGPIDTRLLTQEVHRCYTEVFEHLFSHLDKPDNENDFEKPGAKLKLLRDLFAFQKKDPQDF